MSDQQKATAQCSCGWEGKRVWPSPIKPCPRCGSTDIARALRRPHGVKPGYWNRNVEWDRGEGS